MTTRYFIEETKVTVYTVVDGDGDYGHDAEGNNTFDTKAEALACIEYLKQVEENNNEKV
jgi:hypothetical protein